MSAPLGSVPVPNNAQLDRGYGVGASDFADEAPLSQSSHGYGELGNNNDGNFKRSASSASTTVGGGVSRSNTLKKRSSVRRTGSLKRSGSRKSLRAGSIKGFGGLDSDDFNSAFHTPIPTNGSPTEALANRFQAWRQLLKSLITYFREIQNSYEMRAKALHKVQNTISNLSHPAVFMDENGLGEATRILDDYHKRSIAEANKSRDIEDDVIGALTGLRSDLSQKIKEIKSLSGDFKNSVEKEKESTRKEVDRLQDALENASIADASGKGDPYVVRLGVDRAIEKQIDEENYLHRVSPNRVRFRDGRLLTFYTGIFELGELGS
jgi:gas vesicle protein